MGGGGGGVLVFFFNDTATTEIYTLSLHDALPISGVHPRKLCPERRRRGAGPENHRGRSQKAVRLTPPLKPTREASQHHEIGRAHV